MLSLSPRFNYNGLTIILSNPSRFEKNKLGEGSGSYFFNSECLQPETNIYCCDTRLVDDKRRLLPGTKCILLLGQRSFHIYTGLTLTLDEARGSPYIINGIPCIASFAYQDAVDPQNFEFKFNEDVTEYQEEYEEERDSFIGEKSRSKTARENYRFWLKNDTKKILRILENDGKIPEPEIKSDYIICPSEEEIIQVLSTTKNKDLYLDLETDIESLDMRCLSFGFL